MHRDAIQKGGGSNKLYRDEDSRAHRMRKASGVEGYATMLTSMRTQHSQLSAA